MDLNAIAIKAQTEKVASNRVTLVATVLNSYFSGKTIEVPARVDEEYVVTIDGVTSTMIHTPETIKGATKRIAERVVTLELVNKDVPQSDGTVKDVTWQKDFWMLDTSVDPKVTPLCTVTVVFIQETYTEDYTNKNLDANGKPVVHKAGEVMPLRCVRVTFVAPYVAK